jgi:hypothetical protein
MPHRRGLFQRSKMKPEHNPGVEALKSGWRSLELMQHRAIAFERACGQF